MGFLDIFLGIFLLYGLIRGLWNGFFVELASLVSLMLGIFFAIKFSYLMKSWLQNHGDWNPKTVQVAAFALTFILVVVGISLLGKIFTKLADFAALGLINKLLGGIFGILKMILLLSVFLNLFEKINSGHAFADKETLDKSIFYHPVRKVSKFIYPSIEECFTVFKSESFNPEHPKANE